MLIRLLASAMLALCVPAAAAQPLVIAHRGASGERPEHTLAAYERAIDQGADYIEPDLVATRDGVLVARHENELSGTTDVASREDFADRRRTKTIDGTEVTGWFAEDFTLAELRTLRARERLPGLRPANARFDGLYPVPTLADIVALVRAKEAETGRRIGLYPELKHPTFLLQDAGIDMVDLLLAELARLGVTATDPVFIQSFDVAPLRRLARRSEFRLVQLVSAEGGPADEPAMRYADMLSPSGLAAIAQYAHVVGADLRLILSPEGVATSLVADAREAKLAVHAWTLRKENTYLPDALRRGSGEGARGCPETLFALLAQAGVAGVFADDPAIAVAARGGATCR
ncbi:glycerophosphodiester phosphodiesterase [Leptolyngbya sp. 15MV]|nr:glycerophosphodiester phosphodiesterase [Leptolyngbya sp. 15MV]